MSQTGVNCLAVQQYLSAASSRRVRNRPETMTKEIDKKKMI